MKLIKNPAGVTSTDVTLHVRVWIEMTTLQSGLFGSTVTLHVRVWIEISSANNGAGGKVRHPPREGVD